jgi:hypothetical protein
MRPDGPKRRWVKPLVMPKRGQRVSIIKRPEAQQQIVRLGDVIKEQPTVSVLIALGIGYLLGRLTPERSVCRVR